MTMSRFVKRLGFMVLMSGITMVIINWIFHQQHSSALLRTHLIPLKNFHLEKKIMLLPRKRKYLQEKEGLIGNKSRKRKHRTEIELLIGNTSRKMKYLPEKELLMGNTPENRLEMAHAKYSRIFLHGNKTEVHLGDKIHVRIDLFDGYGHRRLVGGDYLRLWMENTKLNASVSGEVFDLNNGSYQGHLRALWVGKAVIRVFIARRREEIALYYTLYKQYLSIWPIKARFIKGEEAESTSCSMFFISVNRKHVCNLTSQNWGFPWFCEKPNNPNLTCDTWLETYSLRRDFIPMSQKQRAIYTWPKKTAPDFLPEKKTIKILKPKTQVSLPQAPVPCNKLAPEATWHGESPNGFFYNGTWRPRLCTDTLSHTTKAYRECLRNKQLWIPGDSTSVQFYVNLLKTLRLHLNYTNWKTAHGPKSVRYNAYNFTVTWTAHELPFYHGSVLHARSGNIAEHSILDKISNTSEDIVVLYLYVHIILVHPDVFRGHVQRLVLSARNLLQSAPRVTVAVRGPFVFYRSEYGLLSYWGLLYADILHEEFSSIRDKVLYLDFWDMTTAKPCYDVHCPEPYIRQMVQNMMSYLCFRKH